MAGYYGGILFLIFLTTLLLVILGYYAHEQGDYRLSRFNWFLMKEPPKKGGHPSQPSGHRNRRN